MPEVIDVTAVIGVVPVAVTGQQGDKIIVSHNDPQIGILLGRRTAESVHGSRL